MSKRMTCDKCGETIEGTYYEIDIRAYDVEEKTLPRSETLAYNLCNAMHRVANSERSYCKKCVSTIQRAM